MQLNFKMFGSPLHAPVLILHGMFGTLDNWQSVAKMLSERYCVYILDLRNHGRSPHSTEFGYAAMAEDVVQFIESQALRSAHIVGHSMGGKVAMQVAFTRAELVDSLVVVDIAPKTYKGHHEGVFEAMFAIDVENLQSRAQAEAVLDSFPVLDWSTKQFILKNLTISKHTQRYEWRMNLPVIHAHYEDILAFLPPAAPFEGHTLFLRGAGSNYINPAEWADCLRYFPHAQLAEIADAGHWVHADKPQDFVNALIDFI